MSLDPKHHVSVEIRDSYFCLGIGQVKLIQLGLPAEQRLKDRLPPNHQEWVLKVIRASGLSYEEALDSMRWGAWTVKQGRLVQQAEKLSRLVGGVLLLWLFIYTCAIGLGLALDVFTGHGAFLAPVAFAMFAAGMVFTCRAFFAPHSAAKQLVAAARGDLNIAP